MRLIRKIVLAPHDSASNVPVNDLLAVRAALQKQVTRDFAPIWGVDAEIGAVETLAERPLGHWPIIILSDLGDIKPGLYVDADNQPFGLLPHTEDRNELALQASKLVLEMLIDPSGNRLVAPPAQDPVSGVEYLLEVCAPLGAHSYQVQGLPVSDFCTPAYFEGPDDALAHYSFRRIANAPHTVQHKGSLHWRQFDRAAGVRTWRKRTDKSDEVVKDYDYEFAHSSLRMTLRGLSFSSFPRKDDERKLFLKPGKFSQQGQTDIRPAAARSLIASAKGGRLPDDLPEPPQDPRIPTVPK